MNIESFKVYGLHGFSNYEILFEENSLIMVAENGSGKTTLVNIFYYFLSRQWRKLNDYKFSKIVLKMNSKEFIFDKRNYNEVILRENKISKRFSPRLSRILETILATYDANMIRRNPELIDKLAMQYDISPMTLHDVVRTYSNQDYRIEFDNQVKKLEENLDAELNDIQILYLPTYRRIEKDLKNIFPHLEEAMKDFERKRKLFYSESTSYMELVEFGMDDIQERVKKRCSELKYNFYNNLSSKITGSYLEDILNKAYKSFDYSQIKKFNNEALMYLLKRLDDSIISENGKQELKNFVQKVNTQGAFSDEDKINAFFVWKLFQIYDDQQNAEKDINAFVAICNEYIKGGKHLEYDKDNFEVNIVLDSTELLDQLKEKDLILFKDKNSTEKKSEKQQIEYKDLSSGEKQIVSLFSHLILNKRKYFIIIDEPELSLSVPWQERFLPDVVSSGDCSGILAVTHSPFIFRNGLRKYSHSLEEFIIR